MTPEDRLLELRTRLNWLRGDFVAARPDSFRCDNAWDDAEAALDEAASALSRAVYLATEHLADQDERHAGREVDDPRR